MRLVRGQPGAVVAGTRASASGRGSNERRSERGFDGNMIRFISSPRTQPPPDFVSKIVGVFRAHQEKIGTLTLSKGLTSDAVLAEIRTDLLALGFAIEQS